EAIEQQILAIGVTPARRTKSQLVDHAQRSVVVRVHDSNNLRQSQGSEGMIQTGRGRLRRNALPPCGPAKAVAELDLPVLPHLVEGDIAEEVVRPVTPEDAPIAQAGPEILANAGTDLLLMLD